VESEVLVGLARCFPKRAWSLGSLRSCLEESDGWVDGDDWANVVGIHSERSS
jgi:hypothetical protein